MQRIFLLFLVFACATASAQVFRRTGSDGQVYFSDRPGPDAEQVEVTPAQTISLPPVPAQTDTTAQPGSEAAGQQNEVTTAYASFTIVSPASGEDVRANDGNVTVQLSLQPGLMSGHTIMLNVDGENGENIWSSDATTVVLTNLSRGLHIVTAKIVDKNGDALIQADPVSFHVLRVAVGGR